MRELRYNTATTVICGPLVAIADGFTTVDAATAANIDCGLVKHAGTTGAAKALTASGVGATDFYPATNCLGHYIMEIEAGETTTLGRIRYTFLDVDVFLPFHEDFMVITQAEYDRKYSTGATVTDIETDITDLVASLATAAEVVDEMETQMQLDPTGFHVNVLEVGDTVQTAGDLAALITTVDGVVDDILVDTDVIDDGTSGLVKIASDLALVLTDTSTDGVVLKAAGLNADAVDEILDEVVEGTTTFRQILRLIHAFIGGKASGGGTTSVTFRDPADGTNRIVMTVDDDGNRSAVTLDAS